jgi:hypothetical protein
MAHDTSDMGSSRTASLSYTASSPTQALKLATGGAHETSSASTTPSNRFNAVRRRWDSCSSPPNDDEWSMADVGTNGRRAAVRRESLTEAWTAGSVIQASCPLSDTPVGLPLLTGDHSNGSRMPRRSLNGSSSPTTSPVRRTTYASRETCIFLPP